MDGFLLIDKPAGITSHDVVDAVRRIANTRRVGHAGTLDPFATGLLILGLNKATKKLADLVGLEKEYIATAKLGATSTTGDPEGEIIENTGRGARGAERDTANHDLLSAPCALRPAPIPNEDEILQIVAKYRGTYTQTAPAYSAKKVGGKKLYDLARAGKMEGVELPKKDVTIHELELIEYAWPNLSFRTRCSSGTYIRALARDIGEDLGCGAYLTALRRTMIGAYHVDQAVLLRDLKPEMLESRVIPID